MSHNKNDKKEDDHCETDLSFRSDLKIIAETMNDSYKTQLRKFLVGDIEECRCPKLI